MSAGRGGVGSGHAPPPPDPVLVLSGKNSVTSLVFWDSGVLLTGHQNGTVQEWSLPIRRAVSTWQGHSDTVLWLATISVPSIDSRDGDDDALMVSQGRDGLVKAWARDGMPGSHQWTLLDQVPSAPLIFCNSAIIDSTSHRLIATPSEETSLINIHNIFTTSKSPSEEEVEPTTSRFSLSKSPVRVLKPVDLKQYGMCMRMCSVSNHSKQPDHDSYLLVGYESGAISLWNALQGEMLHSHRLHGDSVMGLSCWRNPASGLIKGLSASVDNLIQCWNISDGPTIVKDNSVSVTNEGFNDIAVRKDGRVFVTGGWDNRGRVFGLKKLHPLAVLTYHKESINCVTFGPDNELVLASKDGYITFWDVYKNS